MTQTTLYKAHYFGMMLIVGLVGWATVAHFQYSYPAILLTLLAATIPGRILGFYWRNLLRGFRLLKAKEFAESKRHSELFLAQVAAKPWLKHLVWLGSPGYSRDPEVLALNNLGAAELKLGKVDAAKAHLKAAIELDPQCPLPYFNLAILHSGEEDHSEAERCALLAYRLGYRHGITDRIVRASQARLAATDGAGYS